MKNIVLLLKTIKKNNVPKYSILVRKMDLLFDLFLKSMLF